MSECFITDACYTDGDRYAFEMEAIEESPVTDARHIVSDDDALNAIA